MLHRVNCKIPSMENKSAKTKKSTSQTHKYLHGRRLLKIPEVESSSKYLVIYLHDNNISQLENLDFATKLTSLYLQHNNISKIQNLSKLKCLKKLYLSHNAISVIEDLNEMAYLEELHVEKQRLPNGESLCFDPRSIQAICGSLQVLNISHNNITSIMCLAPLQQLRVIHADHNKIKETEDISRAVQNWYYLWEASFIGNPVVKERNYRDSIIAKSLRLEILDNKKINETTRCFIKRFEQEKQHKTAQVVNLPDVYPKLPKNYAHPLQKAVSSSIIKTGLSVINTCSSNKEKYIAWRALPSSVKKVKRKNENQSLPKTKPSTADKFQNFEL